MSDGCGTETCPGPHCRCIDWDLVTGLRAMERERSDEVAALRTRLAATESTIAELRAKLEDAWARARGADYWQGQHDMMRAERDSLRAKLDEAEAENRRIRDRREAIGCGFEGCRKPAAWCDNPPRGTAMGCDWWCDEHACVTVPRKDWERTDWVDSANVLLERDLSRLRAAPLAHSEADVSGRVVALSGRTGEQERADVLAWLRGWGWVEAAGELRGIVRGEHVGAAGREGSGE